MAKTRSIHLFVLYFLEIGLYSTRVEAPEPPPPPTSPFCNATASSSSSVVWPSTTTQTSSRPLCINEANELSIRTCTDGIWDQEPGCFAFQQALPECPAGFTEIQDVCYIFTQKSAYPPTCPFPNVLLFKDYVDLLADAMVEPVWMPVTRDLSNGLGFMLWNEPNTEYKSEYTEDYSYDGAIKGKDCMVYTRDRQAKAVSCDDEYRGVCAYRKLKSISNDICYKLGPSCVQSDYVSRTACFCVEDGEIVSAKAEFTQPYQNDLVWSTDRCNFGLVKSPNGTYVWADSNQEISYTFWAPYATFDPNLVHAISTPDGWILAENPATCTFTMAEVSEPDITLELTFDKSTEKLNLFVHSSSYVQKLYIEYDIFCFTDALPEILLYRYNYFVTVIDTPTSSQFQFDLQTTFSGNYWCETFRFSDSVVITSEKIFHDTLTFEFVGIFKMKLPPTYGVDPTSSMVIPYVENYILGKLHLTENGTSYVPRLMNIIDVDEEANFMLINIHLSSLVDITDVPIGDKEWRYHDLEDSIRRDTTLDETAQLLVLLSTDFCIGGTSNYGEINLTWPTTLASNEALPDEFCFRADGNLATNLCGGTFNDGVHWTTSMINCRILPESSLSKNLQRLYSKAEVVSKTDICDILGLPTDLFNALDAFLSVNIFRNYFRPPFDYDLLGKCLEKILQLEPQAIIESQTISRTTDTVLDMIEAVVKSSPSSFEIMEDDFGVLLAPYGDLSGLAMTYVNGRMNVTRFQGHWTPEDIIDKIPDLEFAIWLSPTSADQADDGQVRAALMLFLNDTFFSQHGSTSDNVTTVFGMLLMGFDPSDMLPGPVTITHRRSPDDKGIPSCVTWMYDINGLPGFWMDVGTYHSTSSHHFCNFWNAGYFSMAFDNYDDPYNVTADLEGLLNGPSIIPGNVGATLNMLSVISARYQLFNPIDVSLLGQVLETVQDYPDNDLDSLGHIIDNVHRIPKRVLSESQNKHKATDLILYNIDTIIKNCRRDAEPETLLLQDHFAMFVTNVKETNFTGLTIAESNSSVQIEILRQDLDITTIQSNDSLSSAVLLSRDLINQIPQDSRIIITIFFNDLLFNENTTSERVVSTIFGVVLPDLRGNYSGPLTILHDVSSSESMGCAHWNYSVKNHSRSRWKKDGQVVDYLGSRCDFWHTTHFAVLLFNEEEPYDRYDLLDLFTTINSAISLASLSCIVLTGILFRKWRKNIGNQILLNFSLAIILQIVTFYVAETMNRNSGSQYCTLVGVLLHYSVISQFCWMLTIAFLQFKRFVIVFAASPRYLLVKACVCGWVLPLLPVMLALVLDDEEYVMSKVGLCYPSGLGLYIGVWVPIGIIGLVNLVIFTYVVYSVLHTGTDSVAQNERYVGMHQWRLFVLLFFMLGLTWCFGFLSGFDFGIAFAYMFCFTATLQGFILFLYFIVFNANTRRLYVQSIKNVCLKNENY